MKKLFLPILTLIFIFALSPVAQAQYNKAAGINRASDIRKAKHAAKVRETKTESAPIMSVEPMADEAGQGGSYMDYLGDDFDIDGYDVEKQDKDFQRDNGHQIDKREYEVQNDGYGNADGSEYDLAVDGAFKGQTITVLQLYWEEAFDFENPKAALEQKGFNVVRYINNPPSPEQLKEALDQSCQLWIISSNTRKLTDEHLAPIKNFFDEGHGVYIWGDNAPYYADANFVAKELLGVEMHGNLPGDKTVTLQESDKTAGLIRNHLITTGLEFVYEGITIATLDDNKELDPLLYGSANNLSTLR